MQRANAERGGIVTGWLVKLILGIALVGLVVYDAGAVLVTRVTVDQVASEAAREAGSVYGTRNDPRAARREAARIAARSGAELVDLDIGRARDVVEATVRKRVPSVLLHRVGFLRDFATAQATQKGTIR